MAELFQSPHETRDSVNILVGDSVNRLLSMDFAFQSEAAFSAVQKLHEESLYSFDFDFSGWAESTLSDFAGPWASRIRQEELFDGMEDIPEERITNVVSEFPLFGLIGVAKEACNDDELQAVIANIEQSVPASSSLTIKMELATRLFPGLQFS